MGCDYLNILVTDSGASQPDAIEVGCPLDGFFVWSFMDNFEWANGYVERFGITYVDFDTQQRTPKESSDWFEQVVAQNRVL